jgi:hypothetical protein
MKKFLLLLKKAAYYLFHLIVFISGMLMLELYGHKLNDIVNGLISANETINGVVTTVVLFISWVIIFCMFVYGIGGVTKDSPKEVLTNSIIATAISIIPMFFKTEVIMLIDFSLGIIYLIRFIIIPDRKQTS